MTRNRFTRWASRPRRPRTCRPTLETLEDRCLPAGTFPGVPSVEEQFTALKHHGEALGWILPRDQGAPDPSTFDHYQGLARYPGTGTPVFYVTQRGRDEDPFRGGFLEVVRMGSRRQ